MKTQLNLSSSSKHFYLPQLDGLRFLAFFLVFLHHSLYNISSQNFLINIFLVIIQKNGWVGVDLFFVLSGYLITTLLVRERQAFGKYSLKNFWIRRALRIWPLYYLALIVGFVIVPQFLEQSYLWPSFQEVALYSLFLGNWQVSLFGYSQFSDISHLWTISLEEQFYLFWPIILLYLTNLKRSWLVGVGILASSIITRLVMAIYGVQHPGVYTNTLSRIDILTLGAILALILFYKPDITKLFSWMFNPLVQLMVFILFVFFLYKAYLFNPAQYLQMGFGYTIVGLFMVYLVLLTLQPRKFIGKLLSFSPFVWLGKISYGLYVWHILGISLGESIIANKTIGLALAFCFTLILASTSYYFFELRFLKLKTHFARISSRPVN